MDHLKDLFFALRATLRDMLPILTTLALFHGMVLGDAPPADLVTLGLGFLAILFGLTLLVRGLELSLFPIGEALVDVMARRGQAAWVIGFAFALGFGSTVAEPALAAVAAEAASAMINDASFPVDESQRGMLVLQIRYGLAFCLGLSLVIGVWRILQGWPLIWFVLPGYAIIALVCLVTDAPFVAVALDAGTAATSVINIPLMLALGVGLGGVLRSRSALVDGFGLVILASLTPMLGFLAVAFVLVKGG